MTAPEFYKIQNYFKPGDLCAVEYVTRTKYKDARGYDKWSTNKEKEIFEFKMFSGTNFIFTINGDEILINYMNLTYIKKITVKKINAA